MLKLNLNIDTLTIYTGGKFKWVDELQNTACDEGSDLYTSEKVASEEACKKSCQDAEACKSITYWSNGWCSHYSTACKKTKAHSNAISVKLKLTLTDVFIRAACDEVSTGEKYLWATSGRISSLEACQHFCEASPACKSITFWSSGWCSHYSTQCKIRKLDVNAIAMN